MKVDGWHIGCSIWCFVTAGSIYGTLMMRSESSSELLLAGAVVISLVGVFSMWAGIKQ